MGSAVQTKSSTCIKQMTSNIGGGVCNAWNGYVCCLKDAFAGCNMDTQIDSMINTMKTTYSGMPGFADISSCGTASCSGGSTGGGSTAANSPVETTLTAMIQMSDPTTFNISTFIESVKGKTGSTVVKAVLKFWEVALVYSVPEGTTEAALKAAIAKAMNVAEDIIKVVIAAAGGRRLGDKRRLATNADVTMTATDAATAKTLMTGSGNSTKISNLGTELGGTVVAVEAAKAKAKVETKVTTEPSKVSVLTAHLESAGSDVGGTITATVGTSTETLESNTSNSQWSLSFAPLLILLIKMIQ